DMDITADKAQDLAALDTDKKLQALQNWLSSKQPGEATSTAGYYVAQLRGLRAGGGGGSGGNGRCCERQDLLKGLENCLRSYSVQWLEEFMDCGGLDLLLDYLSRALDSLIRCVLHPRYATKTLVLELLAALCMLDGMHAQVLDAFDSLRERVGERRRWETLMTCFRRHEALPAEQYSLEFMVSCARFINIVQNVSNDEQLGQRVCLQA
uniref:Drf_GBD domain-containing protein n=1 Tax=Macrostomum lignano TaxID=282301 RepID=A0A1I8GHS6_9PLAT